MANIVIWLIFFGVVMFIGWLLTKDKPRQILEIIKEV